MDDMIQFDDISSLIEQSNRNDQYEEYLTTHIANVQKGYEWLKHHLPEVLSVENYIEEISYYGELDEIIAQHDKSKRNKIPDADAYYDLTCEYNAYADYFYGEKSDEVKQLFDLAWLSHIHHNPHHWQHWMFQNDEDGLRLLDMPYVFIIEMICDWWSFSWKNNNLYEVFGWYEKNREGILLSDSTRETLEDILQAVESKLNELGE